MIFPTHTVLPTDQGARAVPEEVPVALSYGGTTHAVMMATPADLEDFAVGFTLYEGIATRDEIEEITIQPVPDGIDLQIRLTEGAGDSLRDRHRRMAGPVGCGLCGVESIEQAMRAAPAVTADLTLCDANIRRGLEALWRHQRLHEETHAVHAAGLWLPGQGIVAVREDVGRHNALDKLAGFAARQGFAAGAVFITSRISVEMVQKAAVMGAPVLVAVSAPTALAVRMAEAAGVTLVARARGDRFETYTYQHRITRGSSTDVA
ncbi:FdhD protein [Rubricella aquisinus]|uniref:Sulfur carrier protein FdhD n=1 Tax=Rubricella aquisinus TaxID=2028108 RepID=A0A840X1X9_9RHOB|nr:formate dehydrogenase accessory sulfurtransferase FdhD [Rubricella aquisinus]MBB5515866.1 FdhD protein [Rubricella aquisinus]